MEVGPQEEMANPQDMKVFAVGFLKISRPFVLCVECNGRHSYLRRILPFSVTGAGTG